ncbi:MULTISPECIES: hypothetical protein [Trichocoleus]|uniref:Uncharacterized protein n=1 Tax=Trichocoleus desertorum GB2-A4 TaxID=2933944 RepID=A0ABV0JCK4_9CYAN|nr:hypothetical protein [Trichocoleus sp. FACHB-46]MBD1864168.1 hypothetical protein [Trichocoleus sp. FACHB-46]
MKLQYDEINKTIWMFTTPEETARLAGHLLDRRTQVKVGQSLTVFNQGVERSEMILRIVLDSDQVSIEQLGLKVDQAFYEFNENQSPENLAKFQEAWQLFRRTWEQS